MTKKRVILTFPQKLIKKPVIYTMAKKFDVMPNIRRARVTEKVGEVTLGLSGSKKNLEKGIKYLQRQGVKVRPLTKDVVE